MNNIEEIQTEPKIKQHLFDLFILMKKADNIVALERNYGAFLEGIHFAGVMDLIKVEDEISLARKCTEIYLEQIRNITT